MAKNSAYHHPATAILEHKKLEQFYKYLTPIAAPQDHRTSQLRPLRETRKEFAAETIAKQSSELFQKQQKHIHSWPVADAMQR